jgi:hypothetical protein
MFVVFLVLFLDVFALDILLELLPFLLLLHFLCFLADVLVILPVLLPFGNSKAIFGYDLLIELSFKAILFLLGNDLLEAFGLLHLQRSMLVDDCPLLLPRQVG